jgi:hypothetical protein
MEGGRVQISLDREFLKKRDLRKTREEIYQMWFNEVGLTFESTDQDQPPRGITQKVRYARCVAASSGDRWEAWKYMAVCRFLLNPPGTAPERCFTITPDEYTILDPDKSIGVWVVKHDTEILPRCFDLGKSLLGEIAHVYCLAVELIEHFEETFESVDEYRPRTQATRPADLLRDCKKAAINLITSVAMMDFRSPKRIPDAAIALRQGFLIGRWLAQAEGIIGNVKDTILIAKMGSGRSTSRFWKWVNSDSEFSGKSPNEVLQLLDGLPDPDHPGKSLKLQEEGLQRGDGRLLKTSSFLAKFKKH